MSRERGYSPGRFSFNVPGGRCENCQGDGVMRVEMHFLPDVFVVCETCGGKRYNRETLEARYKGKNIHEVLHMTVEGRLPLFRKYSDGLAPPGNIGAGGAGLCPAGAKRHHPVGRGSAAGQIVPGTGQAGDRADSVCSGRADDRTALSRCGDAAGGFKAPGRPRQHGGGDRAQHGSDKNRGLDFGLGAESGAGGGELVAFGTPEKVARSKGFTAAHLRPVLEREKELAEKEKKKGGGKKAKAKSKRKTA